MKIHYSEFEFGFEDIDYDPDNGDIRCKIFIDTVHPLTGRTKRIYIEDIDILNFMIDCEYDDLKELCVDWRLRRKEEDYCDGRMM